MEILRSVKIVLVETFHEKVYPPLQTYRTIGGNSLTANGSPNLSYSAIRTPTYRTIFKICPLYSRLHTLDKPFKCDFCDFSTAAKSSLKQHNMIHTGERPYKCDQSECNYSATQLCDLKKHKLTHTREKAHKCDHCKASFGNRRVLKQHLLIHSNES